jgi:hypothetical protein
MLNYFIRCFEPEKDKLVSNGILFTDYEINGELGILIEDRLLDQVLEVMEKVKLQENTTTTYGINEIIVESKFLPKAVLHTEDVRHRREENQDIFEKLSHKSEKNVLIRKFSTSLSPRDKSVFSSVVNTMFQSTDAGRYNGIPTILISICYGTTIRGVNSSSRIPNGIEGLSRGNLYSGDVPGKHDQADFYIADDATSWTEGYGFMFDDGNIHVVINAPILHVGSDDEKELARKVFERLYSTFLNGWQTCPKKRTVSMVAWRGDRSNIYKQIIEEELLPFAPGNIMFYKEPDNHHQITGQDIAILNYKNFRNEPGEMIDTPNRMFGIETSSSMREHQIRAYYGMGLPIVEPENDIVVGEYIGNNLYIFFRPNCSSSKAEQEIFRQFLQAFARVIWLPTDDRVELMKRYRDRTKPSETDIANVVNQSVRRLLNDIRQRAQRAEDEVKKLEIKYTNAIREQVESQNLMAMLDAPQEKYRDRILKEIEIINSFDNVDIAYVKGEYLIVITDTLCAPDDRTGKIHEIGRFMITVPTGNASDTDGMYGVRFSNMTRRISGLQDGMNAPHVYPDGHACLGNIQTALPQLAGQCEFSTLIQICIEFLSSANTRDSAGQHINKWPLKEDVNKEINFLKPENHEQENLGDENTQFRIN